MGRKTLESLPGGQPLYGRKNVVLTRNRELTKKGVEFFYDMDTALSFLGQFPTEDIFVIGWAEIYREFLPYCDTAHVTFVDYVYEADAYFPDLDRDPGWVLDVETEEATYFDICYTFRRYVRRAGERGVEIEE